MLTTTPALTTAAAVPAVKKGRTRALCAAGGALAAALAWTIEVPLLGIHLNFRYGTSHIEIVAVSQIIGASLAASLLGWLLLAVLDRRTRHARTLWTSLALAGLAASVALPLAAATTSATTTSALVGLAAMHLTVGARRHPRHGQHSAGTLRQRTRKPAASNAQRRHRRRRRDQITLVCASPPRPTASQHRPRTAGRRALAAGERVRGLLNAVSPCSVLCIATRIMAGLVSLG